MRPCSRAGEEMHHFWNGIINKGSEVRDRGRGQSGALQYSSNIQLHMHPLVNQTGQLVEDMLRAELDVSIAWSLTSCNLTERGWLRLKATGGRFPICKGMLKYNLATTTFCMTKTSRRVSSQLSLGRKTLPCRVSGVTPFRVLPQLPKRKERLAKTRGMKEATILPNCMFHGNWYLQHAGGKWRGSIANDIIYTCFWKKKCWKMPLFCIQKRPEYNSPRWSGGRRWGYAVVVERNMTDIWGEDDGPVQAGVINDDDYRRAVYLIPLVWKHLPIKSTLCTTETWRRLV